MKKLIVGIGEVLWDVFPQHKVLGGAPANFAFHTTQFGCESYIVSAIGDDILGGQMLAELKNKNLKHMLAITEYPTGSAKITLNKANDPQYEVAENVAWDNIPFTKELEELAAKTDAVNFGTLAQRSQMTRETIREFVKHMPNKSTKLLDLNFRQKYYSKEIIEDSLKMATMLKLNEDEVVLIGNMFELGLDNEQDVCVHLLKKYKLEAVIFTRGTNGSFIFTDKETSFLPTPQVPTLDTVGAGNAFTATFVISYLAGKRIVDSHRYATQVAAFVCMQHGAMPTLPDAFRELYRSEK